MRRLRRRATATSKLFCSTNGCASFLDLDAATGVARCPICGYVRRTTEPPPAPPRLNGRVAGGGIAATRRP